MKDFDAKKESEIKEYDYNSVWKEQEDEEVEKKIEDLPQGLPRKGITGKYIKKKGNIGKVQLKKSWGSYFNGKED